MEVFEIGSNFVVVISADSALGICVAGFVGVAVCLYLPSGTPGGD